MALEEEGCCMGRGIGRGGSVRRREHWEGRWSALTS